jgi:hypothetical protein
MGPVFTAEILPAEPEDVEPDPVMFIGAGEEKELSVTARAVKAATENPSASAKVKVQAPYRVTHEGKHYSDGNVLKVPHDTAGHWVKSGWAELIEEK